MPFLNVDIFDDLPLRLRPTVNPYVKRLTEAQSDSSLPLMFGSQLRNMRGQWRQFFSERMGRPVEKIILEIGVHKGKVFQSLAQDNPNYGVVGIDITMKRVVLSAQSVVNTGAKNAMLILGNAKFLTQLFDKDELDGVLIFFPDPWNQKKNQLKKRLINEEFCAQLHSVLCDQGFFWLKTDCAHYFEEALVHMEKLGFEKVSKSPFEKPYESVFESRFKKKNEQTFEQTLTKSPSSSL